MINTNIEDGLRSGYYIAPVILSFFSHIRSVVEVGGPHGQWASAFYELGIDNVEVFSCEKIDLFDTLIPLNKYKTVTKLSDFNSINCDFDLVISMASLQNYHHANQEEFVKELCQLGGVILFNEPAPGINNQDTSQHFWPSHWAALFNEEGFECVDVVRSEIWGNNRLPWQWRQNTLLFVQKDKVKLLESTPRVASPLDIVHPDSMNQLCRDIERNATATETADILQWSKSRTVEVHKIICQEWVKSIIGRDIKTLFLCCAGGLQGLGPYIIYLLQNTDVVIQGYFDYIDVQDDGEFLQIPAFQREELSVDIFLTSQAIFIASPGYAENILELIDRQEFITPPQIVGAVNR